LKTTGSGGFLIFTLGPVVIAAGMSFYHYQLASGEPSFIGGNTHATARK